MKAPFELPAEPKDRYEIILFRVWDLKIEQLRCVYFVDASWQDVYPEDDEDGAPYVDEWACFGQPGYSTASRLANGWTGILKSMNWGDDVFITLEAAQQCLKGVLERRAKRLEGELETVKRDIRNLDTRIREGEGIPLAEREYVIRLESNDFGRTRQGPFYYVEDPDFEHLRDVRRATRYKTQAEAKQVIDDAGNSMSEHEPSVMCVRRMVK